MDWIKADNHKGALHRALDAPAPKVAAAPSAGARVGREARLAQLAKLRKK